MPEFIDSQSMHRNLTPIRFQGELTIRQQGSDARSEPVDVCLLSFEGPTEGGHKRQFALVKDVDGDGSISTADLAASARQLRELAVSPSVSGHDLARAGIHMAELQPGDSANAATLEVLPQRPLGQYPALRMTWPAHDANDPTSPIYCSAWLRELQVQGEGSSRSYVLQMVPLFAAD